MTLPASSRASASTEAPTKVDPSGNTLTIVVGRGWKLVITQFLYPTFPNQKFSPD